MHFQKPKTDQERPWPTIARDFRLCCDYLSFSLLLPLTGSKLGATYHLFVNKIYNKTIFLQRSWNNFNLDVYHLIQPSRLQIPHVELSMLQMHLSLLPSVPNCTSQLKMRSCMCLNCWLCISSPHCSLEINDFIPASFSFVKDVILVSFNF